MKQQHYLWCGQMNNVVNFCSRQHVMEKNNVRLDTQYLHGNGSQNKPRMSTKLLTGQVMRSVFCARAVTATQLGVLHRVLVFFKRG